MVKQRAEPQQPAAPYVVSRRWCAGALDDRIMRCAAMSKRDIRTI